MDKASFFVVIVGFLEGVGGRGSAPFSSRFALSLEVIFFWAPLPGIHSGQGEGEEGYLTTAADTAQIRCNKKAAMRHGGQCIQTYVNEPTTPGAADWII